MRTVACGDLILGEGRPKICVPVTAKDLCGLDASAAAAASCSAAEIVEWRADWYDAICEEGAVREAMSVLRRHLKLPVLFTFRSREEGGERAVSFEMYEALLKEAIEAGADLVDIELSKGDAEVKSLIDAAHKAGVSVIVSSHDFEKTPETDIMMERLCCMHRLGADICKLAVMPKTPPDTLRLLEATWRLKETQPDMLLITMSMSAEGSISRVSGEVFGSVLTFGTVGKASAPGQLEAETLRMILDALHIR